MGGGIRGKPRTASVAKSFKTRNKNNPRNSKSNPRKDFKISLKKFEAKPSKASFMAVKSAIAGLQRINLREASSARLKMQRALKSCGLTEKNFG